MKTCGRPLLDARMPVIQRNKANAGNIVDRYKCGRIRLLHIVHQLLIGSPVHDAYDLPVLFTFIGAIEAPL